MTDREAFLKILSMVMDNFSAYHGYDPEWILNTTKTYFEMYQNIFREEENVSSSNVKNVHSACTVLVEERKE